MATGPSASRLSFLFLSGAPGLRVRGEGSCCCGPEGLGEGALFPTSWTNSLLAALRRYWLSGPLISLVGLPGSAHAALASPLPL